MLRLSSDDMHHELHRLSLINIALKIKTRKRHPSLARSSLTIVGGFVYPQRHSEQALGTGVFSPPSPPPVFSDY